MMSPFDLPGPQFLVVYCALIAASWALLVLLRVAVENRTPPKRPPTNPYTIAYLRGGATEAIRVACATLMHTNLLNADGEQNVIATSASRSASKDPLERAIVSRCATSTTLRQLTSSKGIVSCGKEHLRELERAGLIPNEHEKSIRLGARIAVSLALALIAVTKIQLALDRGRHNIGFLVVLALLAVVCPFLYSPRTTPAGKLVLEDLRVLFARLRDRVSKFRRGTSPRDFAFLVSIFGIQAARGSQFEYLAPLRPRVSNNNDTSSGSSCGSSCSSGSSCGGGGGCGGCGS